MLFLGMVCALVIGLFVFPVVGMQKSMESLLVLRECVARNEVLPYSPETGQV